MTLPPWDYLFLKFSGATFPDLFAPVWISSLVLLGALVVLYNVRTRALRRHPPYLDMWEWLLWTGLITFSLLLVFCLFVWDFIFVLVTMIGGAALLLWIRFVRFPPVFKVYEQKLAKERYIARSKYARPDATIRSKGAKPIRASRRRRRR